MPEAKLAAQLQQDTVLTPRLQQSLKFLQMSTLEFQQAIRHALDTNPFLEDADTEEESEWESANAVMDSVHLSASEGDRQVPDHSSHYPAPYTEGDTDPWTYTASRQSLRDRLYQALGTLPLSRRDYLLASHIVDALDDDGYLRQEISALSTDDSFRPAVIQAEWRVALHTVQQLLAPGIAARDLRECLLLQLHARHPKTDAVPAYQLAKTIVDQHLQRLARNDWAGMRRELDTDDRTLQQACELIRSLDPRPGLRYDEEAVLYASPDVTVDKVGARWRVRLNAETMPQIRLHSHYIACLRRMPVNQRGQLRQELQEARWLIQNLQQRYATVLSVAQAIVVRQHRFFDYGDVALRPLTLRELAEDLELHESTISRATVDKYMLTPRSLYSFRHFFSRELTTQASGTCSATAVRALIQKLVDTENTKQPLSDVSLAEHLADHGIVVARRTVTKYRNQLKIPSVELRKTHY